MEGLAKAALLFVILRGIKAEMLYGHWVMQLGNGIFYFPWLQLYSFLKFPVFLFKKGTDFLGFSNFLGYLVSVATKVWLISKFENLHVSWNIPPKNLRLYQSPPNIEFCMLLIPCHNTLPIFKIWASSIAYVKRLKTSFNTLSTNIKATTGRTCTHPHRIQVQFRFCRCGLMLFFNLMIHFCPFCPFNAAWIFKVFFLMTVIGIL